MDNNRKIQVVELLYKSITKDMHWIAKAEILLLMKDLQEEVYPPDKRTVSQRLRRKRELEESRKQYNKPVYVESPEVKDYESIMRYE